MTKVIRNYLIHVLGRKAIAVSVTPVGSNLTHNLPSPRRRLGCRHSPKQEFWVPACPRPLGALQLPLPVSLGCQPSEAGTQMFRESGPLGLN